MTLIDVPAVLIAFLPFWFDSCSASITLRIVQWSNAILPDYRNRKVMKYSGKILVDLHGNATLESDQSSFKTNCPNSWTMLNRQHMTDPQNVDECHGFKCVCVGISLIWHLKLRMNTNDMLLIIVCHTFVKYRMERKGKERKMLGEQRNQSTNVSVSIENLDKALLLKTTTKAWHYRTVRQNDLNK